MVQFGCGLGDNVRNEDFLILKIDGVGKCPVLRHVHRNTQGEP
jgi:hypothetical protein